MNLENVFVGFTHDGKEHLLYKRIINYDIERSMTIFLDLETNEVFNYLDIDTSSLKPVRDVLCIKKDNLFRINLINIYEKDRSDVIYDPVYDEHIVKKKWLERKYKSSR